MQQSPLDKVVFIQKIAAFAPLSLSKFVGLAYVNQAWADTIQNYAFHLFEEQIRGNVPNALARKYFLRAVKCDVIWLALALLCESFLNRNKCLILVTELSTSYNKFYLSAELMERFCDKIFEVGGAKLLMSQLFETNDDGSNCMMLTAGYSNITSSPLSLEVLEFIFEKTLEVGGPQFLIRQLATQNQSGRSCLMLACADFPPNPKIIQIISDKLLEVGGATLLKNELTVCDKRDCKCLMFVCLYSSSSAPIELITRKIVEVGGADLLKTEVFSRDVHGRNFLSFASANSSRSRDVMTLSAALLHHFGFFEERYDAEMSEHDKQTLKKANINDASWTPGPEDIAKVKEILSSGS